VDIITSSDIKKLPKKYHDQTRYPNIVTKYEDEFKQNYSVMLSKSLVQLTKKMVSIIKERK